MKMHIIRLVFICMTIASLMLAGCGGGSSAAPATATPSAPATVIPPAPTGVTAIGGPTQVTISWSASPGATSYNIYWLKSGTTPPTWTRIANVISPYVQTGLDSGAIYNYFVTAVNPLGESAPSSQVFTWTNSLPTAPTRVVATGGADQVTLTWDPVAGATSYNLYWSTDPGILIMPGGDTADPLPVVVVGVTTPYVWTGGGVSLNVLNGLPGSTVLVPPITVAANTTYYFVVTAVTSAGEVPSGEVSATTLQ